MVVIRLSRGGSRGAPFFNIVVADSRNRRDGRYIERLGFYNPVGKEGAETLDVATVATITRISDHDVEERGTAGTTTGKTDNDHD